MEFYIQFIEEKALIEDDLVNIGQIVIGNFKETFHSSLSYWTTENYLEQWMNGALRIINGYKRSCLVISMYDPKTANFIFLWDLYRIGEVVYIQNRILFTDDINGNFTETKIYDYIPKRLTHDEEGQRFSEWTTNVGSIINFFSRYSNC